MPKRHNAVKIQLIAQNSIDEILNVYRQCEDFLSLGPDAKATKKMVLEDLQLSRRENGKFCGIYDSNDQMIGVVDFVPSDFERKSHVAFISLLMIASPHRRRGIGTDIVRLIENKIFENARITEIHSAVQTNNPQAIKFWKKNDYLMTSAPDHRPDQTTVYHLRKIRLQSTDHWIIVLNAGNDNQGNLTKRFEKRLQGALKEYQNRLNSKILVQGGFGHFNATPQTSAYYASQYLLDQGVQKPDLFAIHDTSSTVEEALSAQRFLRHCHTKTICVVTSHFHLDRTQLIFEHFFATQQLHFVGTPNGVSADELANWKKHEAKGIALIQKQGGVILEGNLYTRNTA